MVHLLRFPPDGGGGQSVIRETVRLQATLASASSYIHLLLQLPGSPGPDLPAGVSSDRQTDRQRDIYLQVMESTCKNCIADLEGTTGRQGGRQAGHSPWSHGEEEQRAGQAFLSMVLKNHSVNLRSWAVAVWDSSCSRMLSCLRCWTSACSTALSCFSCGDQRQMVSQGSWAAAPAELHTRPWGSLLTEMGASLASWLPPFLRRNGAAV